MVTWVQSFIWGRRVNPPTLTFCLENLQILEVYGGQVGKALDYGPKDPRL